MKEKLKLLGATTLVLLLVVGTFLISFAFGAAWYYQLLKMSHN